MASYSVADAKNTLPRLIDRAMAGEEVVITRRGKPVVEMRAAPLTRPRRPGGLMDILGPPLPSVGVTSVELLHELYEDDDD